MKSKIEVVQKCRNKRQFKYIPSNTFLNGSESRTSDPNGWGPRFNAYWGNFFLFSRSEACDANIAVIANFVCLWKTQIECLIEKWILQIVADANFR